MVKFFIIFVNRYRCLGRNANLVWQVCINDPRGHSDGAAATAGYTAGTRGVRLC